MNDFLKIGQFWEHGPAVGTAGRKNFVELERNPRLEMMHTPPGKHASLNSRARKNSRHYQAPSATSSEFNRRKDVPESRSISDWAAFADVMAKFAVHDETKNDFNDLNAVGET